MIPVWQQHLCGQLAARAQAGLLRSEQVTDSPQGVQVTRAGHSLLSFTSNDYLGLANHPAIIRAQQQALERWGNGAGASHLLGGHLGVHQQLSEQLAAFTGRDDCLLFSSGFVANLSTIQALVAAGDTVVQDRLNHASLIDGARQSGALALRYQHGDCTSASQQLARSVGKRLLITDGVFSMDGDIAPLASLADLAQTAQALLMVDDAHGFGVLGANGAGSVAAAGLTQAQVPVYMATLGKALGVAGAFVAGSRELIDYLRQFARGYVYSTAIAPAQAQAVLEALACLQREPARLAQLHANIARFRTGCRERQLPVADSMTAIQWLPVTDDAESVRLAQRLAERGVLVGAVRRPTASARLRITLSAAHTEAQIEQLLDTLLAVLALCEARR